MKITIPYDKLWKILIDKKMKKKVLREKMGIGAATIEKLAKPKT